MKQKTIFILMLLLMVSDGYIDATYAAKGLQQPVEWTLPLTLCFNFLTFLWYRRDSDDVGYPRSRGLNIAVIIVPPVSVPYYLARSRPKGRRLPALLKCAGFAILLVLADALGMVLTGHPLD